MFVCYEPGVKLFPAIFAFETGYQLLHLLRHPLFYFPFIKVQHSETLLLQSSVQSTKSSTKFLKRNSSSKQWFFLSSPTEVKHIRIICSIVFLLKQMHINQTCYMDGLLFNDKLQTQRSKTTTMF
jgi:hypothetical protein